MPRNAKTICHHFNLGLPAALEHIARQAARRIGVTNHRPLLRRAHAGISVALMKRAASMARACLPKLSKESVQLAFGDTAGEEDG